MHGTTEGRKIVVFPMYTLLLRNKQTDSLITCAPRITNRTYEVNLFQVEPIHGKDINQEALIPIYKQKIR